MQTLPTDLRQQLERTVIEARNVAEAGACAALKEFAVHHREPYGHMDAGQRILRRRLRAHARQLGDRLNARTREHTIEHLVQETAYKHWHSMLFARFLAENDLLIEPENDVAITLDECEDLARGQGSDKWALAAQYAHCMLPQVFRPEHPGLEVRLAREYQLKLEDLVEDLPTAAFTATDSLGWVYQFWQTERKNGVNQSEVKIGADELPAVTQLFTEPYMVQFLLHNSLGAWWQTRHPNERCPVDLTYLRQTEDGAPVAGDFEGWPDDLSAFRLLDPCCGSGHFLVAAFLMLVPMRMALEDLGAAEAADAVLRDNLHGLELDPRCVAIAAFALAMEAWRYPGAGGHRPLPRFNLAWCGQPVGGKREQWTALAGGDSRIENGMGVLYDTFRDAPLLGSLIDPTSVSEDMLTAGFSELQPFLEQALREHADEEEWEETAIAARGLTETAKLLTSQYHAVITNVPYLGREKHATKLRSFCDAHYPLSKYDLATIFVERLLRLCTPSGETLLVLPQYWLFLARYKALRKQLLEKQNWRLLATLGPGAFETISGEVVNVCLAAIGSPANTENDAPFPWIDVSKSRSAAHKGQLLCVAEVTPLVQTGQLANPNSVIGYVSKDSHNLLENVAYCYQGLATSDNAQFVFKFWEIPRVDQGWELFQFAPEATAEISGCSHVLFWEDGCGKYARHAMALKEEGRLGGWKSGHDAWGKRGIAINRMGELPVSLYFGTKFDCNVAILIPHKEQDVPAIWRYCSSQEYHTNVRKLNAKLSVTNATLAKVPYDSTKWSDAIEDHLVADLYGTSTIDPAQWAFHGHPMEAKSSLQVAVARLLGYRWPAENDPDMELADEARAWIEKTTALHPFADEDGIVCIPSVRGERPAHERLLQLLQAAWDDDWSDGILAKLLTEAGSSSLDDWLRNRFFEEHCKLFHQRPFVWHIWDGRKRDGFHALVNYHKLAEGGEKGRRLLESLTYSYLGDWISRQQDGVRRGEGGAEDRLAAARELHKRLVAILAGEPPCDLFIRWKPFKEQPIGWEPDINDGVRLNIRPFMAEDLPQGKKGAGVLRAAPNIHWKKGHGKEPMRDKEQFPWFWNNGNFTGDRVNNVYCTRAEKHAARDRAEDERR